MQPGELGQLHLFETGHDAGGGEMTAADKYTLISHVESPYVLQASKHS
jgi:hypothetical protein